jgi:predicted ATPase
LIELSAGSEQIPELLMQMRLQNFRLFRDSGWIDIAPLTCIVGRNSSGKSSVISALLLLKQSIETEVFGSAITPLALSGEYCDLGQFKDLVHNHNESCEISFSFRVRASQLGNMRPGLSAALVELATPRTMRPISNPYRFYYDRTSYDKGYRPLERGHVEARLTFSPDQPFGPSLSRCEMTLGELGAVKFVRTISGERKQHWRTYSDARVLRPLVFRPTSRSFFPVILTREKYYEQLPAIEKRHVRQALFSSRGFFDFIENLLRRSEMTGPFRQPPERRYTFTGFGASRSGPSGEQAIDLLITEALLRKGTNQQLLEGVGYWLKTLKLADSLKIRDVAKRLNLFEVDVKLTKKSARTNLADVGFGVSQVLPVLVQGLLMERGGIYFVQEPEIHLHPDAQAGLADFFIYLAYQGVTSIVETHSEYLLLRLRRRLAEKKKPPTSVFPKLRSSRLTFSPDSVSVLFSHSEGKEGRIEKLGIGRGFQFESLPRGFMSQITEDRMALLQAVSKQNA